MMKNARLAVTFGLVMTGRFASADDRGPGARPTLEDALPAPAGAATGTGTDELSLDKLLGQVEQEFPLLRAAEVEARIAASDLLVAEGGFDASWKTRVSVTPVGYYDNVRLDSIVEQPTTVRGSTVFAGYRLGRGPFPVYDGKLETLDYGEVRVGVNVPLWRNGAIDRRRASLARAEIGRDVAKLTIQQQRTEYRRAATVRYWSWVAAGRKLRVASDLLANATDRDGALVARIAQGDLPLIDRADNARAVAQRRSQLSTAERDLAQAEVELALFLRESASLPSRRPGSLPLPRTTEGFVLERDLSIARTKRAEVHRLRLQGEQAAVEVMYADNQRAPAFDFQLAASQDLGPDRASRPDLQKPALDIALILDVPLQTRSVRGRTEGAAASSARILLQQNFARARIEADVRLAHASLRTSRERFEAADAEVGLARELVAAERRRYDEGESQLVLLNVREQQRAEAELRHVDALLDYHRAVAELKAARGD